MKRAINIDGLEAAFAINKPTVLGAALKIYMLGGSGLSEAERIRAAGSAFLMRAHSSDIMRLVEDLEGRTIEAVLPPELGASGG